MVDRTDPTDRSPSSKGRSPWGRRFVLFLLGLALLTCGLVASAAVWELVAMPDDAYGQHRWRFRRSYYTAGLLAVAFGTLGVVAWVRIRRHQRFGQLMAAGTILGVLKVFFDIF